MRTSSRRGPVSSVVFSALLDRYGRGGVDVANLTQDFHVQGHDDIERNEDVHLINLIKRRYELR